jgi:hypothetical protein
MKVNGYVIKHMVEENYNILMVISMKVNGNWIKQMGLVCTYMLMEQNILDNGKMICKMERVMRYGQMAQNMKVIILKVKNMDMVKYTLLMVQHIKDNLI